MLHSTKTNFQKLKHGRTHTAVASIFCAYIWTLNNNLKIIDRFYLDYLYESRGIGLLLLQ